MLNVRRDKEPTIREMIRSTLAHEVRSLLINLGIQLDQYENIYRSLAQKNSAHEIDKSKLAIRPAAKALATAVTKAESMLVESTDTPLSIFLSTEMATKARDLVSKTVLLKDVSADNDKLSPSASTLHRIALNVERMVRMSQNLFGPNDSIANEIINSTTIFKDIAAIVPSQDTHSVEILAPDNFTFVAYRRELISAASNLIRNGLKYSKADTPSKVTVSMTVMTYKSLSSDFPRLTALTRQASPDDNWICLRVIDTGRGVSERMIGTIFKPFVRLDDSGNPIVIKDENKVGSSANDQGTDQGLGLTLVKRIAELHNGVATAKSNLPNGTVFAILFPYIQVRVGGKRPQPTASRTGSQRKK